MLQRERTRILRVFGADVNAKKKGPGPLLSSYCEEHSDALLLPMPAPDPLLVAIDAGMVT